MDFQQKLQVFRNRIDEGLQRMVPMDPMTPPRLTEAIHHSLFAGGKRIRPVLLLAVFDMNPDASIDPLPAAGAIECLHTYSLIHDDLPSMDDAALRRGKTTCHVAFDEATAVLAGDALLTLPFELIAKSYLDQPLIATRLISELSYAAGSGQMVGGQMNDMLLEQETSQAVPMERIYHIEDAKTGALFRAALKMGGILRGASSADLEHLNRLGGLIGRSFQIVDDILDAIGDEKTVGKSLNSDSKNQKTTAVTHLGVAGARQEVEKLNTIGLETCEQLNVDTSFLQNLLGYLQNRVL